MSVWEVRRMKGDFHDSQDDDDDDGDDQSLQLGYFR